MCLVSTHIRRRGGKLLRNSAEFWADLGVWSMNANLKFFSNRMGSFYMIQTLNLVASCLLGALQHQECVREVGGFGNKPEIKIPGTKAQECLEILVPVHSPLFPGACKDGFKNQTKTKTKTKHTKKQNKHPPPKKKPRSKSSRKVRK